MRWVHLLAPTGKEVEEIGKEFSFHPLDLEDVMSRNQRPKLDHYEKYLFLILHFPLWEGGRVQTVEMDMFLGEDFIVTSSNMPLPPAEELFARFASGKDSTLTAQGTAYLLYLLVDACFDHCFPMLRRIGAKLETLEDDIFSGKNNEIVRDLSNAKQEIINFRKIIRPGRAVMKSLEKEEEQDMGLYFGDTIDAQERIWDMLENYKEVVDALTESNDAVLGREVNNVLRVLTSISVIVLPLTLIASIWGMNVGVPGVHSTTGFWEVLGGMLAILVGMVVFFRRRGWL